jgi:hypothetical protein
MPTYITLSNFTDQGVRNAKDSPKREVRTNLLGPVTPCFFAISALDVS